MQINAYVMFNGQCEAALKFYEQSLGGKIEMISRYEGSPAAGQAPAGWENKILHARFVLNGQTLMASDAPPDRYEPPKGFFLSLMVKNVKEAEEVFQALATDGSVVMPLQQTFWAIRFGMLVDRFGIPWMVNCEGAE